MAAAFLAFMKDVRIQDTSKVAGQAQNRLLSECTLREESASDSAV